LSALRKFSQHYEQPSLPLRRRVPTGAAQLERQPVGPLRLINPLRSSVLVHRVESNQEMVSSAGTRGLEATYVIEGRSPVAAFILRNRLHGLLSDAVPPLNAIFGERTIKVLTLVTDDEGAENLYCLIMTPGDMNEARHHLRAFDEEWWIEHSATSAGKLNFDIELI
jgi:hypothetical protein